ncbi:MAG: helix-turn-helix domain-containing protein [Bilophila wadsworthia]
MRRCAGDRRKVARALGISYSSLRRVLEADAAKDVSVQD